MHGHQADGVLRVDRRVRLVADGELLEVVGDARQRRVAAVLEPPHHRPELLEVLARLTTRRAAQFEGVRGLAAGSRPAAPHGGSRSTHDSQRGTAPRSRAQHRAVVGVEAASSAGGERRREDGVGESRRQRRDAGIRQPDDARPEQRGGPQVRHRVGEIAQQRHRRPAPRRPRRSRVPCRRRSARRATRAPVRTRDASRASGRGSATSAGRAGRRVPSARSRIVEPGQNAHDLVGDADPPRR